MALGLTQPLTEMSTRNISWGWGVKAAGAYGWQPYNIHVPIVLKSGSLNLLEPSGPVQACNGNALPLPLHVHFRIFRVFSSQLYICCFPASKKNAYRTNFLNVRITTLFLWGVWFIHISTGIQRWHRFVWLLPVPPTNCRIKTKLGHGHCHTSSLYFISSFIYKLSHKHLTVFDTK